MDNGYTTIYKSRLNKGVSSKFLYSYADRQITEEGRRAQYLKHVDNISKGEDVSRK